MQLITWTDEILSVGVTQFDNHHKAIVENLNQLYDAIIFNKGKLIIIPCICRPNISAYADKSFPR